MVAAHLEVRVLVERGAGRREQHDRLLRRLAAGIGRRGGDGLSNAPQRRVATALPNCAAKASAASPIR
jgi:hypothetical protein